MLVITIIVMIILATAIILSLNSSNIVEKAKEAKSASDLANAKNVVILAKGEWELMTEAERTSNGESFSVYAERKLLETGYKVNENEGLTVSSNGIISTVYVGDDNRTAIIPEGFTVSSVSTEDSVTEGLVIKDDNGNEFVWVPVDDFSKFERTTTYNGTITTPSSSYTEPFSGPVGGITLSLSNDLTGEWSEYIAMRASVQENNGFYIGRYEAGTSKVRTENNINGTTDVLVQKDKPVYNYVGWAPNMISASGDIIWVSKNQGKGAVELSRNMYKGSTSVVSTLCYGVQWDSALQFIYNTDNTYPTNSENKGNYTDSLVNTGSNETYAVNNIYDMAGNVWEWTMEADLNNYRTLRGGENDGSVYAAYYRGLGNLIGAADNCGFRIALYLR